MKRHMSMGDFVVAHLRKIDPCALPLLARHPQAGEHGLTVVKLSRQIQQDGSVHLIDFQRRQS